VRIVSPPVTDSEDSADTSCPSPVIRPVVSAAAPINVATPSPIRTDPFVFRTVRDGNIIQALTQQVTSIHRTVESQQKKLDLTNRRMGELESTLSRVEGKIDQLLASINGRQLSIPANDLDEEQSLDNIPVEYAIGISSLQQMCQESNCAGNFAAKLTKKFFPELFGPLNLRLMYNWYGGGKLCKQEMDPMRKDIIKRYVQHFYPDVRNTNAWKDRVVPKVNELLRRTEKKKQNNRNTDQAESENNVYTYMNL